MKDYKERLAAKEKEASKTSHLVRISEQRRQENLSLEAKMRVMENKSRELLQQQETAAKGVVAGLSALGHRLDSYLDELVKSYSISGVDIEVRVTFSDRPRLSSSTRVTAGFLNAKFSFSRIRCTSTKRIRTETAAVAIPNSSTTGRRTSPSPRV